MIGGLYSTYGLYAKFQSNGLNGRDGIQYTGVDEIIGAWGGVVVKALRY